jgi:hypothetical protein
MRWQERAQRVGQVFRFPCGRRHGKHEPAANGVRAFPRGVDPPGDESGDQRPQRGRRDEVTLAAFRRARLNVECGTELGVFGYCGK